MAARSRRNSDNLEAEDDIGTIAREGRGAMRSGRETVEQFGRAASEEVQRGASSALKTFDVFNGPMVRLMDQNRQILERMMHAMQEESLRFMNTRLEHTSQAIESTRDCQGISGLLAAQQGFLMDMAWDYAEQTRRFADLMREVTEDAASKASGNGSRAHDHESGPARARSGAQEHSPAQAA